MSAVQRILVPVDSPSEARAIFDYALGLAEAFDAKGTVLHVYSLPPPLPRHVVGTTMVEPWQCGPELGLQPSPAEGTQVLLGALPDPIRARFSVAVEHGDVVGSILEVAARDHADLIVVGTHGRTGVSHLVLGSVAQRLVRRAACPVLTVRLPSVAA